MSRNISILSSSSTFDLNSNTPGITYTSPSLLAFFNLSGIGSGPQKSPAGLITEAKEKDSKNLPKYFEKLSEMALKGDREALFYLIDRHLGKPKASTELEVSGGETLGAGVVTKLIEAVNKRQTELDQYRQLEEGA